MRQGKTFSDSPHESVYANTRKMGFISQTLLTVVEEDASLLSTQRIPL